MDTTPPPTKRKVDDTHRCIAYGCSNTKSNSGFSTHGFPLKEPGILQQWVNFVKTRRKDFVGPTRHTRLCAYHFDDNCFPLEVKMYKAMGIKKMIRLNHDAVPTIHAPISTPTKTASPSPSCTVTSGSGDQVPNTPRQSKVGGAFAKREHKRILEEAIVDSSRRQKEKEQIEEWLMEKTCREVVAMDTADEFHAPQTKSTQCKIPYASKHIQAVATVHDKAVGTIVKTRTIGTQCNKLRAPRLTLAPPRNAEAGPVEIVRELPGDSDESETDCDEVMEVREPPADASDESETDSDGVMETSRDPDYQLSESEESVHESDESDSSEDDKHICNENRKYIVTEPKLRELFNICRHCNSKNVLTDIRSGEMGCKILVDQACGSCRQFYTWCNTGNVGNTRLPSIDIEMSCAILYSGSCPTKALRVMDFLGVQCIQPRTFMAHQRYYMQPSILELWNTQTATYYNEVRASGHPVVLGGDGRCDTPGHSAKYGAYSLMDLERGRVMCVKVVQSNEVDNSYGMEKEGLIRSVDSIKAERVKIGTIITDRHSAIRKWIGIHLTNGPDKTKHLFDVWHVAKALMKRLYALGKQKDCEIILAWLRSIVNHMYWVAASTPSGDGKLMWEKWASILNHLIDVHEGHSELYQMCEHGPLDPDRPKQWMRPGTKAYEKLQDLLTTTQMRKDIPQLSPAQQTSSLESYHSVVNQFAPKMTGFSYNGMVCRTLLAAMHFNENGNRSQKHDKDGKPKFCVTFPKEKKGGYTLEEVKEPRTYGQFGRLLEHLKLTDIAVPPEYIGEIERLKDVAGRFSAMATPFVMLRNRTYYAKMGITTDKGFWTIWREGRDADPSLVVPAMYTGEAIDEETSDRCISEMFGTAGTQHGKCHISDQCWKIMTEPGYQLYSLSHQIFFLECGLQFGCREAIEDKIKQFRQPKLDELTTAYCSNMLAEAQAIAEDGFIYDDLFMEQATLCGMLGFRQFFTPEWLRDILRWQEPKSGCYNIKPVNELPANSKPPSRTKREERVMTHGCLSHRTTVAAGALAMYVRYILDYMILASHFNISHPVVL